MSRKASQTEQSGAKRGRRAFYGRKAQAKNASNRRRRQDDKQTVLNELEKSPQLPTARREADPLIAKSG